MTTPSLRQVIATARAGNWWSSKLPPLLAVAYAGLLRQEALTARVLIVLGVTLVSLSAVAWHAHVVNDLCDIDDDRRSGKPNRLAALSTTSRILLVAILPLVALGVALNPIVGSLVPAGVLAANMVVFVLYSMPPVRLKAHRWWGVAADAIGAHLLPTLFVLELVSAGEARSAGDIVFGISALFWSLAAGLRGIIVHQFVDRHADRAAGLSTVGTTASVEWARALVLRRLLPVEALALAAFTAVTVASAPLLVVAFVTFLFVEWAKLARRWTLPLFDPTGVSVEPYRPLLDNSAYELWLPNVLALQIGASGGALVVVPILQLGLFGAALRHRLRDIVRLASADSKRPPRGGTSVRPSSATANFATKGTAAMSASTPPGSHESLTIAVGATYWVVNGVNVFSANLARGLLNAGHRPHVLLTESATELISFHEPLMPRPGDVPFVELPVKAWEPWGAHWGEMIRYLESIAPCIYIPNSDWRHSNVSPLLSNRVGIVGIVHSDDPLHYDHVLRLGAYWNAIVCVSRTLAERTAALLPHLAERIHTIPIGVAIPDTLPARARREGGPLRIIYHGSLKVHQKRVLDLPRIMGALAQRGIPAKLTIVGGGPDEALLREQARDLEDRGFVEFLGVVGHDAIPGLLECHDVYLLASEFEGMPNALIEAMGHGLVPVVTRIVSGPSELVRHGDNGFLVEVGDIAGFAECLTALEADPSLLGRLGEAAFESVKGSYRLQDMVADYQRVCRHVMAEALEGRFARPSSEMIHPRREVDDVSIFPVDLPHHVPGVGRFPGAADYASFRRRIQLAPTTVSEPLADVVLGSDRRRRRQLDDVTVIVGSPLWTRNGVNVHSENLVRGLGKRGIRARLLVTEEQTDLVTVQAPRMRWSPDVPVDFLAVSRTDGWGAHWGAMIRYLEAHAPCVYLPTFDWRHACVLPQVAGEVYPVATVFPDDAVSLEQAARLEGQWAALVARDPHAADRIAARLPGLADRIRVVPDGRPVLRVRRALEPIRGGFLDVLVCGGPASPTEFQLKALLAESSRCGMHLRLTSIGNTDHPDAGAPVLRPEWGDVVNVTTWPVPDEFFDRAAVVLARLTSAHIPGEVWRAMAWGCVPAVFDAGRGIAGLFRSGENCGVFEDDDIEGMGSFLRSVGDDADLRDSLSLAAHQDAQRTAVSVDDMIDEYVDLFADLLAEGRAGGFSRPAGPLLPPPGAVGAATIFPVSLPHEEPGVGRFATADDAAAFRLALGAGGDGSEANANA